MDLSNRKQSLCQNEKILVKIGLRATRGAQELETCTMHAESVLDELRQFRTASLWSILSKDCSIACT